MAEPFVVFVTAGSAEEAERIARALVEDKLAACVNLLAPIQSIYRWEGKVEQSEEVLLVVKTTSEAFEKLRARVIELHGYECPEVVGWSIQRGHGPYLRWIDESVRLTE
ncbi:MAG: divalent-cation tolerance protein CutA [Pseudomonadota bacterium]